MARDSLFGEEVLWTGRPASSSTPRRYRLATALAASISLMCVAFAATTATALGRAPTGLLMSAASMATLALAAWQLPKWFGAEVEYVVTAQHVIWRRGRLRRSIERAGISYAVIRWSSAQPGVGDIELVRAVPTGALARTLRLTLTGVAAPDRVLALVRGVAPAEPLGSRERPLAQRLDEGERVLWSERPAGLRWGARRLLGLAVALGVALAGVRMVAQVGPIAARLIRLHALTTVSLASFVAGFALAVSVVAGVAVSVGYAAVVRPLRLTKATRYFVTDRRVLIRRGDEELHLDRDRITAVIATPPTEEGSSRDVYLVLDGPRSRGLASHGAFDPRGVEALVPVFTALSDAETACALLDSTPAAVLRDAA